MPEKSIDKKKFEIVTSYYDENFRQSVELLRKALSDDKRLRKPVIDGLNNIIKDAKNMLDVLQIENQVSEKKETSNKKK